MSLFIGIEAVGVRQSVVVAADETGRIVAAQRLLGDSISLHATDRILMRSRLRKLLRAVAHMSDRTLSDLADASICIGMQGMNFPFDAEQDLREELARLEIKLGSVCCTGDAEIVLASHAATLEGSVMLCNVGASAFIAKAGRHTKIGGLGPALGDDGSGVWIGREALRSVGNELRAGKAETLLWKRIDEWLLSVDSREVSDWQLGSIEWRRRRSRYVKAGRSYDLRSALIAFANDLSLREHWAWRSIVAGLVIPVMAAWLEGDDTADRIVRGSAKLLAGQLREACESAGVPSPTSPLIPYGGAFVHQTSFRQLVIEEIRSTVGGQFELICTGDAHTMRPACGALLLALGRSTTGQLRLPSAAVIDQLRDVQANWHREGQLKND